MAGQERRTDHAARRALEQSRALGREIRMARLAAGLSQRYVAESAGLSQPVLSRLERGVPPWLDAIAIARALAVVGLELGLRAYPGSGPFRDAAHLALLARFRRVASPFAWMPEVALPIAGDRRAWDLAALQRGTVVLAVEAETRLVDAQALCRRLALKKRDGGVDRLVLVLADTRGNRAAVMAAGTYLRAQFPGEARGTLAHLRAGRVPPEDAIVFV
jgi:transcriptional regulator with XRE-family HTH domain